MSSERSVKDLSGPYKKNLEARVGFEPTPSILGYKAVTRQPAIVPASGNTFTLHDDSGVTEALGVFTLGRLIETLLMPKASA
jgi:hypothetical protein